MVAHWSSGPPLAAENTCPIRKKNNNNKIKKLYQMDELIMTLELHNFHQTEDDLRIKMVMKHPQDYTLLCSSGTTRFFHSNRNFFCFFQIPVKNGELWVKLFFHIFEVNFLSFKDKDIKKKKLFLDKYITSWRV